MISQDEYNKRRNTLYAACDDLIFLQSPKPVVVNADETTYTQNSYIYYLTGISEPITVLLDCHNHKMIVFFSELSKDERIWSNQLLSKELLIDFFGADEVYDLKTVDSYVQKKTLKSIPLCCGDKTECIDMNILRLLVDMRMIKSESEIALIEQAQSISKKIVETLSVDSAQSELDVRKQIDIAYIQQDVTHAFTPIVTIKGNILHNTVSKNTISEHDCVLIDTGCKKHNYCSDITRCLSKSSFRKKQQSIYDIVFHAKQKALSLMTPQTPFREVRDAVHTYILLELQRIGMLKGNLDDLINKNIIRYFLAHSITHSIGLDVHDCADAPEIVSTDKDTQFQKGVGFQRTLQENMVLTIEPGIYFFDEYEDLITFVQKDVYLAYAKEVSGIRLEDICVVTKTGARVL